MRNDFGCLDPWRRQNRKEQTMTWGVAVPKFTDYNRLKNKDQRLVLILRTFQVG